MTPQTDGTQNTVSCMYNTLYCYHGYLRLDQRIIYEINLILYNHHGDLSNLLLHLHQTEEGIRERITTKYSTNSVWHVSVWVLVFILMSKAKDLRSN